MDVLKLINWLKHNDITGGIFIIQQSLNIKFQIAVVHYFISLSGETSAGKSSVLNLLFEDDILPVHNNSSTSTITLIRYHKRKHAKVVYKDDTPDMVCLLCYLTQ